LAANAAGKVLPWAAIPRRRAYRKKHGTKEAGAGKGRPQWRVDLVGFSPIR
jgi:hypothetical protein